MKLFRLGIRILLGTVALAVAPFPCVQAQEADEATMMRVGTVEYYEVSNRGDMRCTAIVVRLDNKQRMNTFVRRHKKEAKDNSKAVCHVLYTAMHTKNQMNFYIDPESGELIRAGLGISK